MSEANQFWTPGSSVLLVQSEENPEDLADARRELADLTVDHLLLPGPVRPPTRWRQVLRRGLRRGAQPPAGPDSAAIRSLRTHLGTDHRIHSLLALDPRARRVTHSVLRSREDVIGFDRIDSLARASRSRALPDLSAAGIRSVRSGYTYEAVRHLRLPEPTEGKPLLVVGPHNTDGVATSIAGAVGRSGTADAFSLTIGRNGSPADLMASRRDWNSPEVREAILAEMSQTTHLLLTGTEPADLPGAVAATIARVSGFGEDPAGADFTLDPGLAGDQVKWLPVTLPPGIFLAHGRVTREPRVLVLRDPGPPAESVLALTESAADLGLTLVDLQEVPGPIRLVTAAGCDIALDLRSLPSPDLPALAALAGGAVLVSDLTGDWSGPIPPPPHLSTGGDIPAALADALTGLSTTGRRPSREYAKRFHDGTASVAALAGFLGSVR